VDKITVWPTWDYWVDSVSGEPLKLVLSDHINWDNNRASARYTFTWDLASLNKPVAVVAPDKTYDVVGTVIAAYSQYLGNDIKSPASRRDDRRVSDIKQIMTALEMYYSDASGRYPDSLATGTIAINGNTYMSKVPTNAAPAAGVCDSQKDYAYQVLDSGRNYKITYCLEEGSGRIAAGVNSAGPSGITTTESPVAYDNLRRQDISYLQTYLETYFDANNKYPNSLSELKASKEAAGKIFAARKDKQTSDYSGDTWPTNPKPVGTGCPDADYAYTVAADNQSYTLNYCLNGDQDYSYYGASSNPAERKGPQVATLWGMTASQAESRKMEVIGQALESILESLMTNTVIGTRERDSRRVSDVKQIMTAVEMYYNDAGRYPDRVVAGEPIAYNSTTFMAKVPGNAQPIDGSCPDIKYYPFTVKDNGNSYELGYCLGSQTGSINAGPSTATPAGIQ
jgi:general secretion pathway protein G